MIAAVVLAPVGALSAAASRHPHCRAFSRRLQLDPGLVPPTSWSFTPCGPPKIYCRAEPPKCPGPGGDLSEDRKIYGNPSLDRQASGSSSASGPCLTRRRCSSALSDRRSARSWISSLFPGIRSATECMRCSVASSTCASSPSRRARCSRDIADMCSRVQKSAHAHQICCHWPAEPACLADRQNRYK